MFSFWGIFTGIFAIIFIISMIIMIFEIKRAPLLKDEDDPEFIEMQQSINEHENIIS